MKSKHIRTPSCTLIPKSILGSLARNDVAQKTFLLNNKLRDTFSVKSACLGHSLLSLFTELGFCRDVGFGTPFGAMAVIAQK